MDPSQLLSNMPPNLLEEIAKTASSIVEGMDGNKQQQDGFDMNCLYYSENTFHLLSQWINLGSNAWKIELSHLRKKTSVINPKITDFLSQEGLDDVWANIQDNAPSKIHFAEQFHRWFDGLKTIRLLKIITKNA